ncbi:hypothetical protein [Streptomyces sp. YKOK-I1]
MPLINGADRNLRWFIEDVWGHFDADHTRPGAPLFPSERKNGDGSCSRATADVFRRSLADAAAQHLPTWAGKLTANPTTRLKTEDIQCSLLPMTDAEVLAVQRVAVTPAQRLTVALAAVHATRATAIRRLTLDDLDLPNRRIPIAGHAQRLGELPHQTLLAWLAQRRITITCTKN